MKRSEVAEWIWRIVVVVLLGTIAWSAVTIATTRTFSVRDRG
jgi:hypothetical protein